MKISVNDQEFFTISELQKKVICNDVQESLFDEDMKRRVAYIISHKYEQCFKRLKDEWEPKLAQSGAKMIPTNPDAFAEMVFSHPEYKNRSARESVREII